MGNKGLEETSVIEHAAVDWSVPPDVSGYNPERSSVPGGITHAISKVAWPDQLETVVQLHPAVIFPPTPAPSLSPQSVTVQNKSLE